ncbi:MAG: hypothetical protein WAU56_07550 [Steroidobacteraceae bacterium]
MRDVDLVEPAKQVQPAADVGRCPCDACRHSPRCAARQLACLSYSLFCAGKTEQQWSHAERAATHERWQRLFESEQLERNRRRRRARRARAAAAPAVRA